MKKLLLIATLFAISCSREESDRLVNDCIKSHTEAMITTTLDASGNPQMTTTWVDVCDQYELRVIINKRKYRFKITGEAK